MTIVNGGRRGGEGTGGRVCSPEEREKKRGTKRGYEGAKEGRARHGWRWKRIVGSVVEGRARGSSLSPPRIDFARQTVGCWAVCLVSLTRCSVSCGPYIRIQSSFSFFFLFCRFLSGVGDDTVPSGMDGTLFNVDPYKATCGLKCGD